MQDMKQACRQLRTAIDELADVEGTEHTPSLRDARDEVIDALIACSDGTEAFGDLIKQIKAGKASAEDVRRAAAVLISSTEE